MAHILVVDDDDDMRDFVASLLRRDGHETTTAADGLDAMDLLLAGDFALCVVDHQLPGLTGLEVVGAYKASGRTTRFVLMSGLERLKPERLTAADEFVRKPFDADQFLAVVRRLLAT